MANFEIFVGRNKELIDIQNIINTKPTPHLILIDGDGGVGKTFLLQRIVQMYKSSSFVIDYYDLAIYPPGNIREATHLVESLGWQHFSEFRSKLNELAMGDTEVTDIDLPKKELEVLQTGLKELAIFLQEKKLLRITDTLEAALPNRSGEQDFFEIAKLIPNAIFISAGRNVKERNLSLFQQVFGEQNITYIHLEGFSITESAEFFNKLDADRLINPKMRKKLHFLTGGRPILLSLAAEWLQRDIPLPEIAKSSLKKLQFLSEPEQKSLQENFRFELVDRIRRLRTPIDKSILYMAQITKRFNQEILSILLDISIDDAQELLKQIAELSFVRYDPTQEHKECRLHDEMRHLVLTYAWPSLDPDNELRKEITQKIITNYYEPHIQLLSEQLKSQFNLNQKIIRKATISENEWELWRLEAECLHYNLQLGKDKGINYFKERYLTAQRSGHQIRIQFLMDELERYDYRDILDFIEIRKADQLRMRGAFQQSVEICERLLKKSTLTVEDQVSAFIILGQFFAYRDSEKAEYYYRRALKLSEEKSDQKTMGVLFNNLGQLYSQASQLDKAIETYEKAISYSKTIGNLAIVASATNNMAFVYRLKGDLAMAEAKCTVAMNRLKQIGGERDIAYGHLTTAEIDRDKGDLELAENHTKLAFSIFEKIGDRRGQAMAYRFLGNIERHRGNYEQSEAYINQGITLATEIGDEVSLARLYHVYGQEQRRYALSLMSTKKENVLLEENSDHKSSLKNALTYFNKSQDLAEKYGDKRLLSHNKLEIILVLFLQEEDGQSNKLQQLLKEAWDDSERLQDEPLRGHVLEVRGDLFLREHRYLEAAEKFAQAAACIGKYTGREADHFFEKLKERVSGAEKFIKNGQFTFANELLSRLPKMSVNQRLQVVRIVCQDIVEQENG